ncbi:Rep family protein, partial [Collinsella aerofaciens]|uniref:Rep family protein n=1 Tax=Collinsella aerofaciens TaxID=74426 RepID=UPI00290F086A
MPYKDKEKQREAQRKWEKENRGAGKRHKVWMGIFYPDTAEDGWRDECDELGLSFLVSPLHDRDVWTAADERRNPDHIEGKKKEPHYHFLAEYPQPVDYATVKEDFAFLHTHSIKYAKSKASMALYLTHERCDDKAHYDSRDVLEFGGANWHDW